MATPVGAAPRGWGHEGACPTYAALGGYKSRNLAPAGAAAQRRMMRQLLLLAALAGLALGAPAHAAPVGPAPPAAKPAITQADIDGMIRNACLKEGGQPAQCSCGLEIAREGLSERQFGMFPILWPIVNSKGDVLTKIAAGVTALQASGYNASDGLQLMATLQANAGRVEQECAKPKVPSPPASKP